MPETAVLEFLLALLLVAVLTGVAGLSFARPRGVYWRSVAGVVTAALAAVFAWNLVSPSNDAGFGAFVLWCAVVALSLLVAATACIAATLRHVLGAMGTRTPSR